MQALLGFASILGFFSVLHIGIPLLARLFRLGGWGLSASWRWCCFFLCTVGCGFDLLDAWARMVGV